MKLNIYYLYAAYILYINNKHLISNYNIFIGFSGGSDGKEFTCNAGNLGLISRVEDPLEESKAIHSSILAWRIPIDRGAWKATVHGITGSQTGLSN